MKLSSENEKLPPMALIPPKEEQTIKTFEQPCETWDMNTPVKNLLRCQVFLEWCQTFPAWCQMFLEWCQMFPACLADVWAGLEHGNKSITTVTP